LRSRNDTADRGDQVQNFERLTFRPIQSPDDLAVYEARLTIQTVPGAPEYMVTATTAKPGSNAERTALEAFLSTITVAFARLAEPIPVHSGGIPVHSGGIPADSGDVAPEFDPNTEIMFQHGVEFGGPVPKPTGVVATLKAATGPLPIEARDTVDPYHKDHVWPSKGGPQQATVHIDSGRGTIRPPLQYVVQGGGDRLHRYYAYGTRVTVHGYVRMTYDLDGNFTPP
jgi:hypothetical protein